MEFATHANLKNWSSAEFQILRKEQNFAFWKKSDSSEMIKKASDFFQKTKFCPVLNIYNSADDQFFKFAWIANSMLTCTV